MNKKGFTLVELLITIVILALIVVIAVPSIAGITQNVKKNMLEKKTGLIEEAAILLGQDIKGSIISSQLKYDGYSCKSLEVKDLVPKYLDKDNDVICLGAVGAGSVGCIVDPSDKKNYLDNYEVIVYYRSKRIYAVVDIDNTLSCS